MGIKRIFLTAIFLLTTCLVYAQLSTQDTGTILKQEIDSQKTESIQKAIKESKEEPKIEDKVIETNVETIQDSGKKLLVKQIEVRGATLLRSSEISSVIREYEGKEMDMAKIREIADHISDIYRKKGYATSFAYVPVQKIENNTLIIQAIEGRVGSVLVTGNKWFKTKLLMRYLDLKKDEFFNYESLKDNIRRMNGMEDVEGRTVLTRGEDTGTTNVEVQVKDHMPLHAILSYNNYNSRFIDRGKTSLELRSTNFLGFGDILSGEIQKGVSEKYALYSTRYLFPVTPKTSLGVYYLNIDQKLGHAFESLNISGKGNVFNVYASHKIIDKENLSFNINPSFEYKDINNRQDGVVTSEDNTRFFRLGFDLDATDNFRGRTIITQEFDFGIPNLWGGNEKRDQEASRPGSAGNFIRSVTNFARVQAMPLSTVLFLKGALQYSNYSLPSAEQFQVGGYYTVRGYPVSEFAGDSGLTMSAEIYIPSFFIPKDIMVPKTNTSLHDALSLVGFYDWGYASNRTPAAGEINNEHIYSAGVGARFNITDAIYVSLDYALSLGQEPSDASDSKVYIETKIYF